MQYAYDQLGRLISAATAGVGGWGLAWVYDGFGNLNQQTVTKGSAPSFSLGVDSSTNRAGGSYDANGNLLTGAGIYNTYDTDNRLRWTSNLNSGNSAEYRYSVRNERVVVYENGARQFHFYGVDGLLLGVYTPASEAYPFPVREAARERVYFHGRLLQIGTDWVATDRLGSVVRKGATNYNYAPYGQEIGGATENNTAKFATYTRDTATGYDYAMNRYYNSQWGRFTTPDPYQASGGPADPGSWNRYAYVGGDPVNYYDPPGLLSFLATGTWDGIPGRYEVSNADCSTRIDMGFMGGVAFCAGGGGWVQKPREEPRGGSVDSIRPSHLVVIDDCYVKGSLESGATAQRNILYRLYNAGGGVTSGFTIWEHLTGDIPISGASSPGPPTSTFHDQHSVLTGRSPQQLTQRFTATNEALGYYNIDVFVRGFRSSSGVPTDYGVLAIYKTRDFISINGDYGGTFRDGKFIPNKICD